MTLNYEQFTPQRVRVDLRMIPGFDHGFRAGELSGLYGALNRDDLFESCELRARLGARFSSEHWTFDIGESRLWIRSRQFLDLSDLTKQIQMLLSEARTFLGEKRLPLLLVEQIALSGVVPEAKGGNVAEIVKKKLLKPLKDGHTDTLPGLVGAGVRFVGDATEPEDFHWHLLLDPWHGRYSNLIVGAELFFAPFWEDHAEDDLDAITRRLAIAYNFLTSNAKSFSESVLP
jgi:hypothetical protein